MSKQKNFNKYLMIRFVWIILVLTVFTGTVISIFYFSELKSEMLILKANESINISSSKEAISKNLNDVAADLTIISKHKLFTQSGTETDASMDNFANDILIMIKAKKRYDQIRFLDETGMEVVRVNFNKEQPYIVAQTELQDKSNRYYFKETFELSKGSIFISPFDLNVEKGKIELPYKPMIRLGMPVFDKQGNKLGVIIINYFGKELISDLLVAATNIVDHVTLLNSDSYWLHNPDPDLEWGFMLENDKRFKTFFPGSWEQITEADSGQFLDDNGLFTYDTLYPFPKYLITGTNAEMVDPNNVNYYWKLVSHISTATIHSTKSDIKVKLFRIGGPLYILLIFGAYWLSYALSKRKQVEYELEQYRIHLEETIHERTADLEEANAELLEYSRIVAHDLRAPLRAIRQYTDFLSEDLMTTLKGEQKEYFDELIKSVIKADTLVSDLLHLARIDRKSYDMERVDTGSLLKDVWDGFAFQEEITVEISDDNWPIIEVKPLIFEMLFQNLISNAVKFNESAIVRVELGWHEPDVDHWEFYIRDNGIGIDPRFHAQIFKNFERLHTDEEYEGTGVGLAIVRKAVSILHGSIRIESKPGEGSVFYVTIPKKIEEKSDNG